MRDVISLKAIRLESFSNGKAKFMTGLSKIFTRTDALLGHVLRGSWHRVEVRRAAPVMAVVLLAAALFVGLFYVWTRMQIVQVGYGISKLELKNKELKNRKRELSLEIASLQSPGELEKKARKHGLVAPVMERVVHVPEGKTN